MRDWRVDPLSSELVDQIADKGDGIPFYIEELAKAFLEAGPARARVGISAPAASPGLIGVPPPLRALIMARLDRLGPKAKQVAQLGAAIGREFHHRLISAIGTQTDDELQASLTALADAGLISISGKPPEASYIFRHALVQDAAYSTLLRHNRKRLHAAIARELSSSDRLAPVPQEVLARHCAEAGLRGQAVHAWKAAARQAVDRGSFTEAETHLRKGLHLIAELLEGDERDRQEVAFQNALGNVLVARCGYTAPETHEAFGRARALSEKLGEPAQALRALWGLGTALFYAGQLRSVLRMMEDAAPLVEANGHLDARLAMAVVHGTVLLDLGQPVQAREKLEATLAMDLEPERDRERAILYGQSPRVMALGSLGSANLLLGHEDEGRILLEQCLAEAEKLAHRPMLFLAHGLACRFHWIAGKARDLSHHAPILATLAAEQGSPLSIAISNVYCGWTLLHQGRAFDGVALLQRGKDAYKAAGADLLTPFFQLVLARGYMLDGRVGLAKTVVTEAIESLVEGEERWIEAELHRALGDIELQLRDPGRALESFRRARDVAVKQGATLFENRAGPRIVELSNATSVSGTINPPPSRLAPVARRRPVSATPPNSRH